MLHSWASCQHGPMKNAALLTAALTAALLLPRPGFADDAADWRALHREVQAGRIQPLEQILDSLGRDWLGEVIEVEVEREDGRWVYEIELLGPQGQVVEFEIDAASGEILEIEGRDLRGMRRP